MKNEVKYVYIVVYVLHTNNYIKNYFRLFFDMENPKYFLKITNHVISIIFVVFCIFVLKVLGLQTVINKYACNFKP